MNISPEVYFPLRYLQEGLDFLLHFSLIYLSTFVCATAEV